MSVDWSALSHWFTFSSAFARQDGVGEKIFGIDQTIIITTLSANIASHFWGDINLDLVAVADNLPSKSFTFANNVSSFLGAGDEFWVVFRFDSEGGVFSDLFSLSIKSDFWKFSPSAWDKFEFFFVSVVNVDLLVSVGQDLGGDQPFWLTAAILSQDGFTFGFFVGVVFNIFESLDEFASLGTDRSGKTNWEDLSDWLGLSVNWNWEDLWGQVLEDWDVGHSDGLFHHVNNNVNFSQSWAHLHVHGGFGDWLGWEVSDGNIRDLSETLDESLLSNN